MTADEFEAAYAERSGVTVEWLRARGRVVVPCACGDDSCEGWASVAADAAEDYQRSYGPANERAATVTGYADQAAQFIAEAERHAALGLPTLPDDPAAAAAMRAAGYEVLAEVAELDGPVALVSVAAEDEEIRHAVRAGELAAALGVAAEQLAGQEFLAGFREPPEAGPVLSGFRPVAGKEMTVHCLLVFGDQAELLPGSGEADDVARWPAAAIMEETGLQLEDLPGKRFRVR